MKSTNYFNYIYIIALLGCFSTISHGQNVAVYDISFTTVWNSTDHSDNGNIPLPSNAHWSNLVGATHKGTIHFFENGTMASPGIEDVAEIGVNTAFNSEVNTAIGNGDADQWLQQPFVPSPGAISTATMNNISIDENYPFLTLVSMIAPSPDWFIGIDSFSMLDGANNWKNTLSFDVFAYDAGTEEGTIYSTTNAASTPHQNISSLTNVAPFNNQKLGALTLTFISTLGIIEESFENSIAIYPNPIKDKFSINNTSKSEIVSIEIFDILGKLVYHEIHPKTVDISTLQKGIYFAKLIMVDSKTVVKKLIKY